MSRSSAELDQLVEAVERNEISRAEFFKRAAGAGIGLSAASAVLAEVAAGALAATPSAHAVTPKRGGTLRVAVTPPSYPIDPHKSGDPGARATFMPTIDYLVRVRPNLAIAPELATSWSSKDARVWTVKLRRGVKFHHGKPFTADDVVATFDRLVDPKSGSEAVSAFASFLQKGGTKKIDDYTVRFELTRPVSGFPYSLYTYQAAILPADYTGDFSKKPVGTGPFKLAKYTPKQGAEYVRNPNYWKRGLPYLDAVKIVYFEDVGAQANALQSGTVDLMLNVALDTIDTLKAGGGIKLLAASSSSHAQLGMRVDRKPFNDKRVRQALALTLDRGKIVKQLFGGLADIGNDHLIAPVYPLARYVKVPQRKRDIAKAKQLLAAAGYPNGVDVELRTHNLFSMPQYAQVLQQMAKDGGIRVKLRVEPDDIYYQHWNTAPFAMEAWIHRPWPSQLLNLAYSCKAPWNVPHMCNKRFDALVTKFDATVEQRQLRKIATDIAALMQDETPAIIGYFYKTTRAVRSRVQGHQGDPTDYLDLRTTWLT